MQRMETSEESKSYLWPLRITGVFVLLITASLLSMYYDHASWFTLLIIYTFYLALHVSPRTAVIIAAALSAYTSVFNMYYRRADFAEEFFFVIIVWLLAAYVPSTMKRLSLRCKESEEFHRSILEATPYGIVETKVDGTITFCNKELLRIVAAERKEQVVGKNVLEFIIPERREKARELMRETLVRGSMKNLEYTALRVDGNTGEQELSIAVRYRPANSHPTPAGYIGIVRDVTEEKKNVREAARFRHLLDQVNDGIFIHSVEEMKIVDVNEAALTMSGYSREELLQKSVLDLDVGTNPQEQEELKREVLEHGTTTFETVTLLKDGSKAYTEVKLSKIEMQREPYLVSVVRDVTRIKRAEKENRERKRYFEALLESSPSALITLNAEDRIDGWNPGAESLFHFNVHEVMGREIDDLLSGDDPEVYREAVEFTRRVGKGEHLPPTEGIRFTREGDRIETIITASPIMMDGEIIGSVAVYTDNTGFKRAEREVTSLLREKEQLLKEVHHRIKNHMGTISSIISLNEDYYDDARIREVLGDIHNKIRVMQNIYQSLYIGDDVSSVQLSSFFDPLLRDLETAYVTGTSIPITTDIEDLELSAKQSLPVGIIVNELVTNALKYSFPGRAEGSIRIAIRRDEDNAEMLRITVADDGAGIPDHIVANEDYGFGLTLVKGYAQQFDGEMRIRNDGGTIVDVWIVIE